MTNTKNNMQDPKKPVLTQDEIQEVPQEMVLFAESLIEKAGLSNLPEDFFDIYRKKLAYEAMRRVGIMVMLKTDKEKIQSLFEKQEELESNPAEAYKIIKSQIPEVSEITKEALKDFESEFLIATKKNG